MEVLYRFNLLTFLGGGRCCNQPWLPTQIWLIISFFVMALAMGKILIGSRATAFGLALLIGAATVFAPIALSAILDGPATNFNGEWGILAFWVAMVSAPFMMLALYRIDQSRPWFVAIGVTIAFWSLPWIDALVRKGAGGANIGLAFIMIVSPFVISLAAFVAVRSADPD